MSRPVERCLFVVATPIGNLADITLRALEVLRSVDLILSESVNKTRKLLAHYEIPTPVASYRESNARRMIPKVIEMLESGRRVALVAEAGTPGISDPGRNLVEAVYGAGFRVVPVPGASALIAAVSISGSREARFFFEGFLPRTAGKRKKRLRELARLESQVVFFEAPHRLVECLKDMHDVLGDRLCFVARELTKVHEETVKDRISNLIKHFEGSKPRGEFVLVCEGWQGESATLSSEVIEEARRLMRLGLKPRQAAKAIASRYGLRSGEIYQALVDRLREQGNEV